jgi:hypothetical protein
MKLFRARHDRPNEPERLEPLYHLSHPRPRTRRQFLGQGFIGGAAMVASPSLFGLLGRGANEAYAQVAPPPPGCGLTAGGAGRIPFICMDLTGGANMVGSNVLVGLQGGFQNFLDLDGYELQGLPAAMTPVMDPTVINTTFGLPFHANSAFLLGMLDKTTLATQQGTNGAVFCARSSNDTQNNPHNPMYGIARTGSTGGLLTLIGTEPSDSGGNSMNPAMWFDPAVRPTKIDRPQDATGLVDTGRLVQFMDTEGADAVMSAVERLSNGKVDKLELTEQAIVTDLIRCAYEQSTDLVALYSDPGALDPRQDPFIATGAPGVVPIFNAQELDESKFQKTAAVMKLVVDGHAGAGTIEFGGYDYHNGTRATGERRDFEAGQAMGACLEYAQQTGKELCLYVFSDGSLDSNGQIDNDPAGNGKGIWQGDNSSTASSFMLVYSPTAQPLLLDPSKQQIGWFRPSGGVDTNATEISNNPESLAEAVVANYLALHGEETLLDSVLPGHQIGSAAPVQDVIAFDSIRG